MGCRVSGRQRPGGLDFLKSDIHLKMDVDTRKEI